MKSSTATAEKFSDFLAAASSEEIETAFNQLGSRENVIRDRLRAIEAAWPGMLQSNTPEQQMAVRAEVDALNLELKQLAARIGPLLDQKELALRREAPALAASWLKAVPAKLQKAEETKAAWLAAKQDLAVAVGQLAAQRVMAREISVATKMLDAEQFDRLTRVLDWLPEGETLSPSNQPARSIVSRLARQRSAHLDEEMEQALARAWNSAGASPMFGGTWPEE